MNEINTFLRNALEHERKYEWRSAADYYQQVIDLSSGIEGYPDAQTWEKIGFSHSLASRQTESLEDFKKFRRSAEEAYRYAADLYERQDPKNQAKREQCLAVAEYIGSWLSSTPHEKREKLDKSRAHGNESLKAYEVEGDYIGYGIMGNYLLTSLFDSLYIASDWNEMRVIIDEGKKCTEKTIAVNAEFGTKEEILRSYSLGSLLAWYAANISEKEEERKELMKNSLNYSERAMELSGDVDDPYTSAILYWAAAFATLLFTENVESSKEYAQKMLEYGDSVRDNYLKGVASYVLAWSTYWMIIKEDETDKKKQGHERIINYAQDAFDYLQLVSQDMFIAQAYSVYADSCSSLADDIVISSEKKGMVDRAIEVGRKGLEHARLSGSPDATGSTLHALSKALHLSSNYETTQDEKIKLLEEALFFREEYIEITQRSYPFTDWSCGVGLSYKGLLEAEMARIEVDPITQITLLEKAISDMEKSVSLCGKVISSRPVPTLIAVYGSYQNSHGEFLDKLYSLTEEKKNLRKAIEVYEDAAKKYKEINLPSRAAESYWKRARDLDLLGENNLAAEDFEKAYSEYEEAAESIPNFAHFYHDYANYMKAWSNIERARHHHSVNQYDKEHEYYQNAAVLHEKTDRWKYLGKTYRAWAKLAEAEDLSRKEQTSEARGLFNDTADLFTQVKISIEAELGSIDDNDEKEMATELVNASDSRREYCLGRIDLEEAKLLDRQGEHAASSKKYASAATTFQSVIDALSVEDERQELKPILHLCRAWEKMTQAEVEASPELYNEASLLFDEAKEYTVEEKTKQLIMGHASFCKALEAGTRFETSREKEFQRELIRHLGSATNLYIRAGFEPALEYSKGTQRVFEAYVYLDEASREADPRKKEQYYRLAERVLAASLEAFTKAKHPEKRDEVNRLLSSVKQERELAISLSDILDTPTFSSSTQSFLVPTPSHEQPVGLERFENADIHAKIFMSTDMVTSGEAFDLELELYNTGNTSASLIRVEKLIPDDFEVIRILGYYRFDDESLDLMGKKVGPLGTVEISLRVKPLSKAEYIIKPSVIFLDDTGEYKSAEPEPASITVKELGILSWLRGTRPSR